MGQLTSLPTDMLVDVTNRCNHACVFCAGHKKENVKLGEIDPALLLRILEEGYDLGLKRVGLYTTGEMFLCKNIATHIKNAKKIGYEYIYADTNGALASEEKLTDVITAGVDSIKFSINAGKKETYRQIHGYDDFDTVIENLKICHKLKAQLNPELKIMVSFVVTKQTEKEVSLLQELVSSYVDEFFSHPLRAYFQQYDDDISHMLPETFGDALGGGGDVLPCWMVLNRIHVTWNGYYSACCVDFNHDLLLSNLNTTHLKDAWFSRNAQNFREKHLLRQVEGTMCHGCSLGKYVAYSPLLRPE